MRRNDAAHNARTLPPRCHRAPPPGRALRRAPSRTAPLPRGARARARPAALAPSLMSAAAASPPPAPPPGHKRPFADAADPGAAGKRRRAPGGRGGGASAYALGPGTVAALRGLFPDMSEQVCEGGREGWAWVGGVARRATRARRHLRDGGGLGRGWLTSAAKLFIASAHVVGG